MRKLLTIALALCLCLTVSIAFASCEEKPADEGTPTTVAEEGGEAGDGAGEEVPNPDPIVLTPDAASLTGAGVDGSELQVEAGGNLGYWKAGNEASLAINVPKAGKYTVTINYSKGTAEDAECIVAVGDATASVRVAPTADWTTWTDLEVGTLDLAAGDATIVVKPGDMPESDLMNLMTLTLTYQA